MEVNNKKQKMISDLENLIERLGRLAPYWHLYPENKPKHPEPACIVITKDYEIVTNVFWHSIDSEHEHSIWKKTKYWIRLDDLKGLPKEREKGVII